MSDKVVSSADDYERHTLEEHIYKVPDTYIGSVRHNERKEWALVSDPERPGSYLYKAECIDVTMPVGIERLFIEVLSNAGDNIPRSRKAKIDPGMIEVTMTKTTITVANGGYPIPIAMNTKEKVLAPDMIFGSVLTSSNYSGDREGAGRNGYGAKLTNIFSKSFIVEIGDTGHDRSYHKAWSNNMKSSTEAKIQPYSGENYVRVTYTLDFERFELTEYPEEAFGLFARLCADLAYTQKIPVKFNGTLFKFKQPSDFAKIYFHDRIDHGITIYLWPKGTKTYKRGRIYVAEDPTVQPIGELFLLDTPNGNSFLSFINGMMTRDGGVHVDGVMKVISKIVLDALKEQVNRGKKVEAGKTERFPLTIKDVISAISCIASFHLINPEFASQTKTCLTSPKPYVHIETDILDGLKNWHLMDRLHTLLEMKAESKLSKTDGKKGRFIGPTKADECNWAGGPNAHHCILMVFEGDSAAGYGKYARDCIPNGNNIVGLFPLRGKMLNAMNATRDKLHNNKEIAQLKKVLGLCEGVDYRDPANFKRLRYGKVMIATDADVDGYHIKGLTINYFWTRFKELFEVGFFQELKLPIIKLKYKSDILNFFTLSAYREFVKNNPAAAKIEPKYFKGLGTSTPEDVKRDFKNPRYIKIVPDGESEKHIRLAFDKSQSHGRKQWISGYEGRELSPDVKEKTISDFINCELITFSIEDVKRSIPGFMDGLKPVQRKILYAMFQKWNIYKKSEENKDFKTAQFAAYTSERTKYHHGETSMEKAIAAMTQSFVGSNNLPYFNGQGMFGTRNEGGKAASPRYTYVSPIWWIKYVYRKEDFPLMTPVIDEGVEIEPETYFPIIPMALVNGAHGIGTGWSTRILNHHPKHLAEWLKARIRGAKLPNVYPWYHGFRGTLEVFDRRTQQKVKLGNGFATEVTVDENLVPEDLEEDDVFEELPESDDESSEAAETPKEEKTGVITLITKGTYTYNDDKDIVHISELPIGRWTQQYKTWLEQLAVTKKISTYNYTGTTDLVGIDIHGHPNPTYKGLRLIRTYSLSNMVLITHDNKPVKFQYVTDLLETFYQERIKIYAKRKALELDRLTKELQKQKYKKQFIDLVRSEQLLIFNRHKDDVYADMNKHGIPIEFLENTRSSSFTKEAVEKIHAKVEAMEIERKDLENKSPGQIWIEELDEFIKEYNSRNIDKIVIKKRVNKN